MEKNQPTCTTYDLLLAENRVVQFSADSGPDAATRYADLHQTEVVAWRLPSVALLVGTDRIVG
jgi:hypothetical protein